MQWWRRESLPPPKPLQVDMFSGRLCSGQAMDDDGFLYVIEDYMYGVVERGGFGEFGIEMRLAKKERSLNMQHEAEIGKPAMQQRRYSWG